MSAWIEKARRFWSARLDALDDLLRAEDAAATQEPNKKRKAEMTAENAGPIVITRLGFSIERVFDAWLDPSKASKFLFATPTGKIVRVEIDARVGGSFIIARRDGEDVEHVGLILKSTACWPACLPVRGAEVFGSNDPRQYRCQTVASRMRIDADARRAFYRSGSESTLREGWDKILDGLSAHLTDDAAG